MSGFNTIKKSRKRSHEIEEKLNVLNRELEKTKDIQEQPTVNTGDLYTKVQQSEPSDFQGPLDVPNTAGVGDDDFTQSSAGSGEAGHAPSYSDTSQLSNSSVNSPVFESPNGIEGAAASFGVVEYTGTGAGTNYGVILGGNIVELVLGGFIAGGTRAAQHYIDIYEAYLATNESTPGFYSDEEIAEKRIAASRASSVEGIRNSAAARGLEFNIPWQGYRQPQFQESLEGRTTFVHGELGTLVLSGFKLLGLPATYHIGGDRGGTTAGPSKGTGDPDQYPPLNWFQKLGREAFQKLKEFAEAVGNIGMMEPQDFFNAAVSGAFPKNPENNYAPDIAGSIADGEPRTYENDDIPDDQKEKLIKNMNWNDIGGNIPITPKPTNYSDDNFYVNDDGKVTPHTSDSKTNFPPNTHSHQGNTPNYNDNPLANAGEFHFELVVPEDGSEPYFNYEDHAYYNPNSADKGEVPNWLSNALANVSQAAGSQLPGYPDGIKGDVVKKVKIPLSTAAAVNPDIKNSAAIKSNPNLSSFFKESYRYSKHLIKENAYMALLDRTYKPTERDYVKYAMDTPSGRKQFDKDVKMVHEFIKKNPEKYEYVMKRYPKDDPRLSMLNYRMDRMTEASDKYLETQFPTNQTLFTKVKERTKKNMNLTDPKNFKPVKDPIKYVDVKKTKKLKETVTRHFNKPVKSKSMFGLNMGKVRKTNQKMIEKREQEQRVKEEEKAYIQEKMSRQKSNWKDDLTIL